MIMKQNANSDSSSSRKDIAMKYSAGKISAKTYVEFRLIWQGKDLIVKISGGASHIGSLAYTCSKDKKNKTFQQYTHITHREDEIVRLCIEQLIDLVPGELIVVGGIHYDNIVKEQILEINRNCSLIISRISNDLTRL